MQQRPGGFDGDIAESLRATCSLAHDHGLSVWFRLMQPTLPTWFENEGGLSDRRAAATHWPRWVELVAEHVGDYADGWVPFEAPVAMAHRLEPSDARRHGELVHHLFVAWRDAWRILRGRQPVVTSIDASTANPEVWEIWVRGLIDGIVRAPGRMERRLDELAGACDVFGLAVRSDAETLLYRVAERTGGAPLALTYRPLGASRAERAHQVTMMWREVDRAAEELRLQAVVSASFADTPGVPGLVTSDRDLHEVGAAFTRQTRPR